MTENKLAIRLSTPQEDEIVAEHFYRMWLDLDFPRDAIASNWQDITLKYIENARQNLQYRAFVAEVDSSIVGSASCQLFDGLYPWIFKPESRQYGYIWGVYVEKSYRDRGIGKQLTSRAREYLESVGCTRVVLHASPQGKPVYDRLGFVASNQMHFDF